MSTVGHYIRDLRIESSLSLRDLAAMLAMTPAQLGRIERNLDHVTEAFVRTVEVKIRERTKAMSLPYIKGPPW